MVASFWSNTSLDIAVMWVGHIHSVKSKDRFLEERLVPSDCKIEITSYFLGFKLKTTIARLT